MTVLAAIVMNTSRVPADQFTALPPLLDERMVVRASVVAPVNVPRPTSQPPPALSTAA